MKKKESRVLFFNQHHITLNINFFANNIASNKRFVKINIVIEAVKRPAKLEGCMLPSISFQPAIVFQLEGLFAGNSSDT